jgi:hypothetical protein
MNELDLMVVVEVPGRSLAVGEGSWRRCKPRLRLGAAIIKSELEGVMVLYGVPLLLMVLR